MTAPTTTTKTTTMTTKAMACHVRAPEPRARFTDLLAAEWIKLWSLRSTIWAFAATLLVVLFVSLSTTYGDYLSYPTDAADRQEYFRLYGAVGDSFPGAAPPSWCSAPVPSVPSRCSVNAPPE